MSSTASERLRAAIRDVPDFPKPGILFKDITPVLADPELLKLAVAAQLACVQDLQGQVDMVVGMEARGFLFGPSIAQALGAGFAPVRKPGKLPAETLSQDYGLEYGTDTLQIHADAIAKGQRVLVVDDLLATGGTAGATCSLIRAAGGRVLGCLFLIELGFLPGRAALGETRCDAVIVY